MTCLRCPACSQRSCSCRVQARLKVPQEAFDKWRWGLRTSSTATTRTLEDLDEPIAAEIEREGAKSLAQPRRPPAVCMVHDQAPQTRRAAPAYSLPEAQIKLL